MLLWAEMSQFLFLCNKNPSATNDGMRWKNSVLSLQYTQWHKPDNNAILLARVFPGSVLLSLQVFLVLRTVGFNRAVQQPAQTQIFNGLCRIRLWDSFALREQEHNFQFFRFISCLSRSRYPGWRGNVKLEVLKSDDLRENTGLDCKVLT